MPRTKKPPLKEQPEIQKPEFSVYTFTLTPAAVEILQQLSRDASDFLGRSIGNSAIVRALICQVSKQGPGAADALFLEVERELKAGIRWGGKK